MRQHFENSLHLVVSTNICTVENFGKSDSYTGILECGGLFLEKNEKAFQKELIGFSAMWSDIRKSSTIDFILAPINQAKFITQFEKALKAVYEVSHFMNVFHIVKCLSVREKGA